jgi:hypothetical protein
MAVISLGLAPSMPFRTAFGPSTGLFTRWVSDFETSTLPILSVSSQTVRWI